MKLAAIDIGSNSIKLLVVNAISSDSFVVTGREKEAVRLGHETLHNRRLSDEAINRAVETIKRYRSVAESREAEKIFAVATASVRAAENAAEFIRTVERETGIHVEIIPGVEEARLIGIAAVTGCATTANGSEGLLNIDIGGGSTEISVMRHGQPVKLFSVKLGAVGLTEEFIFSDPPKGREIARLQDEITSALERPTRELRGIEWHEATGTSGTILALGEIVSAKQKNAAATGAEKGGKTFSLAALEEFIKKLVKLDLNRRLKTYGMTRQRAEIIIAGSCILHGTMKALKIKELTSCNFSLREGIIIDNLRRWEEEATRPPIPDLQEPRLRGVLALAKRFNFEQEHSLQIARLAEAIFDGVAAKYNLDRSHRLLLSAASLLHDIGYYISHESHHKHSAYLIRNSELTGFSEEQRSVIAAVARYHRGALPKEKHPEWAELGANLRAVVMKLSGILRVADALDRSYDNRIENLRVTLGASKISIKLESEKTCEREIQAAEQKRELFEIAFDCRMEIS
ncbi:MAG TPA: Ppx/GppA phosphatase family protein [Pyrinomonadaceae bacterium]|nr:Ppx/GppA phosphatase family protein [Pyrinomonadaceae bacterium]